MYLEKLEIQGFKSFAHKNKLIFSGMIGEEKRGLTAIVGPNGSGKSNVADSIRWALGEQSMKTLRGKKSEDIIFSGSDKKSQLGFAEVSLILNNEKRPTPKKIINSQEDSTKSLETNSLTEEDEATAKKSSDLDQIIATCSEIVITRRIFRNGDSEYLLNSNRVRLSDIQMLLAKANFGQKTYSVIGQGMVENFLNSSAAERKDFFDEATGVKQFQIKRDSALGKLESSYENLQQVDMLLSEIRPRLKSLTRQVEKLKRRDEIEKDLRAAQLNYYGFVWHDINHKLDNFNKQYLEIEKTKLEKDRRLEKLDEDLNRIRATDNFREINELQPRLRELENQKGQYQKKLAKLQAELEIQLESQGQFDVSWLNNKSSELAAELENLTLEINSLENSRPKAEEETILSQLQEIGREIAAADEAAKSARRLDDEKFNLNRQLAKLEAIMEAQLAAKGQIDVSWLTAKQAEIYTALENITKDVASLQETANTETSDKLRAKLDTIQKEMSALNQELIRINEKIKTAAKSGTKNEEITRIVEEFLNKLDNLEKTSDLETVRRLIKEAKNDFQSKIKTVLTGESDEDARRIQEIQQTIIQLAEKKQALNDQLNAEAMRLASIREKVTTLTEQRRQLERELSEIKEKITKAESDSDTVRLENEKSAIAKQLAELEQKRNRLEEAGQADSWQEKRQTALEKLQLCRLKDSAISERLKLLQEKKIQTEREAIDIKSKLQKSQINFDASGIEKEKTELTKLIENTNQEISAVAAQLEKLNQAKEKEKSEMFACQKDIQSLQQEISTLSDHLNNLKIEAARQETRLEDLENNIRNDNLEIGEISSIKVTGSESDLSAWQKVMVNGKNQLDQIGGIDPETEKEYTDTKERYDFLSTQTADLEQAIKSLEHIIYELDLNIKGRFDQEFKIISEKFNEYFQILFNGGSAKMSKIMIEDLEKEDAKNNNHQNVNTDPGLTAAEIEMRRASEEKMRKIKFLKKYNAVGLAGIEIQATPPGKKIQSVTMLSGGERALTAIALICAIISANPSPFVVLDEVDAALDESNSERLAKILDDLSDKTQFIVITHNRASMRRASILYGVTMQADGVSQILSVKLDELAPYQKK